MNGVELLYVGIIIFALGGGFLLASWWRRPQPVTFRIARLNLQPGDILALTTEQKLSPAHRAALKASVEKMCIPDFKTLVIDGGFKIAVLHGDTLTLHKEKDAA